MFLHKLNYAKQEGIREILEGIINNSKYHEKDRTLSIAYLERRFAENHGIEIRSNFLKGSYSGGYPDPIPVQVQLTNKREEPVIFKYHNISEVLGFWVNELNTSYYLKPKTGVEWFTPKFSREKPKHFFIGSGETRTLTINLLDYFDKNSLREGGWVNVRCKIPGIHELPIRAPGSHGMPRLR